jgi:Fic-DOC domain mobile mystery protein B
LSGLHDEPSDATPLSSDEKDGLIPSHVTLRRELNELEQQNILEADAWVFGRKRNPVDEAFGKRLHKRMFRDVWSWAGTYRTSNKNLGADRAEIQQRLYAVLDNVRFWIENKTYPPDEIAVRFHHALALVHPFPNGNGRWSRLMADTLAHLLGQRRFTWGRKSLRADGETRQVYIEALKAADNHDFAALIAFARS